MIENTCIKICNSIFVCHFQRYFPLVMILLKLVKHRFDVEYELTFIACSIAVACLIEKETYNERLV